MGWLQALKARWLRGRPAGEPPESDPERDVDRLLTTPDAATQVDSLPDEQKDDILDQSTGSSSSPDLPR